MFSAIWESVYLWVMSFLYQPQRWHCGRSKDGWRIHALVRPVDVRGFSQTRAPQLNAKAMIMISTLPTLLLAKSAISHAWAVGMKQ